MRDQGLSAGDVLSVEATVPPQVVKAICEPEANKKHPGSAYDAQFSVHYITAASLIRGQFGLAELDRSVWTDPEILDLTGRVSYTTDESFPFPEYYSGQVRVVTKELAESPTRSRPHTPSSGRTCRSRALPSSKP